MPICANLTRSRAGFCGNCRARAHFGRRRGRRFRHAALGKGELGNLVYIQMTRTPSDGATLLAVDKQSGEVAWDVALGSAGWSSAGVRIHAQRQGLRHRRQFFRRAALYDGLNGRLTSICDLMEILMLARRV